MALVWEFFVVPDLIIFTPFMIIACVVTFLLIETVFFVDRVLPFASYILLVVMVIMVGLALVWLPVGHFVFAHRVLSHQACDSPPEEMIAYYLESKEENKGAFLPVAFAEALTVPEKTLVYFLEDNRFFDQSCLSYSYNLVGRLSLFEGDNERAESFFRRALESADKTGNKRDAAEAYHSQGLLYVARGDLRKACRALVYAHSQLKLENVGSDWMQYIDTHVRLSECGKALPQGAVKK